MACLSFKLSLLASLTLLVPHVLTQVVADLSNSEWTLQNLPLNISIPASFPSYAHLDLHANQVTGELEYGLNDYSLRWIWMQNWTYTTTLDGLDPNAHQTYLLFQGQDTFATVELCGQHVASTNNQFRQWYFDVSDALASCGNETTLSLNFGSAPMIAEAIANEPGQETWAWGIDQIYEIRDRWFIRKEQNDFGWDWGPAYAPAGPWLPGYVIQLSSNEVHPRNVLIDAYKEGQRNNMIPDQSQNWIVNASIDYIGELPHAATMRYTLTGANNSTVLNGVLNSVNQTNGTITGTATIENGSVDLWWPVKMGPQTLYNMTVEIRSADNQTLASVTRRMGFRTIVLNEMPVDDQQLARGIAPGNNWHFEINGHPLFAKGSNFIPPDVFWPRVTPASITALFDSVLAGNQNLLRVWSSGAYSPDFIYDLADEMGILLWSEFEFGCALYPADQAFLDNVYEEAVYQVRRVNHHPSLTYWAGGNEMENLELPLAKEYDPDNYDRLVNEYEKLFLTTIFPAVFENSHSISYSPSSTSYGFVTLNFTEAPYMQERYRGMEEPGKIYGDTDHYDYDASMAFNTSGYPVGRFANEFGFHSMPSVQTWRAYIPESELYFNSTTILKRNRHNPPGNLNITDLTNSSLGQAQMTEAVQTWYPVPNKADPLANFTAWIWSTQVFQADYYGSQIQFYRRGSGLKQRTLGSLYWQLEDQWAAPTWAGIERSGRWKVLHYRAKDLYQNVIISPFWNETTRLFEVWVTSDLWEEVNGSVDLEWYSWNGSAIDGPTGLSGQGVTVGGLNSTRVYKVNLDDELGVADPKDVVVRMNVSVSGTLPNSREERTFEHTNWWHAAPLKDANLVDPGLEVHVHGENASVTLRASSGVAAWVWVDYDDESAVVVFDSNGFWMGAGEERTLGWNVTGATSDAWIDTITAGSIWNNTVER